MVVAGRIAGILLCLGAGFAALFALFAPLGYIVPGWSDLYYVPLIASVSASFAAVACLFGVMDVARPVGRATGAIASALLFLGSIVFGALCVLATSAPQGDFLQTADAAVYGGLALLTGTVSAGVAKLLPRSRVERPAGIRPSPDRVCFDEGTP